MRVLFDIDVILDLLLDRRPFANDAGILLSKAELVRLLEAVE